MGSYIIRRLLMSFVVLFMVTIITFSLIKMVPGDAALVLLGDEATQEQIDALRKELWLDRPVAVQYIHWLVNTLQGNLGKSTTYGVDAAGLIVNRLPVTLHITLTSLVLSSFFGILFGIISALKRGTVADSFLSFTSVIGVAIPIFWLGIIGIYLFGYKLGWLPIQGYTSPFEDFVKSTRQIIMPVFCSMVVALAMITRQTRSSMLEVIRQDYIRTARSKGLSESLVILKHSIKNSMLPVITLIGLQLRMVVGGSVLIETVFNIPGIGQLMVTSVLAKDFIVVQACTLLISIVVLLSNLLVDISYGWLDPRIQYD